MHSRDHADYECVLCVTVDHKGAKFTSNKYIHIHSPSYISGDVTEYTIRCTDYTYTNYHRDNVLQIYSLHCIMLHHNHYHYHYCY